MTLAIALAPWPIDTQISPRDGPAAEIGCDRPEPLKQDGPKEPPFWEPFVTPILVFAAMLLVRGLVALLYDLHWVGGGS